RVITHRIAHLVLDQGVPSESVLAVTFTNKAAGEMKARAEGLLAGGALRSWISTFHSLCVRILRRESAAAGLPAGFVIFDEDDQVQAVRQALRELDLPEKLNPPRRLLSRISARKNSGRDTEAGEADSVAERTLDRVLERYTAILSSAHAVDFDDLLLRAVALLGEHAMIRDAYRSRFRYVLVDEYQDTNRAQYELIRHLVGPQGNVTVVGDEDQSIYSWRGADINNILDFERDFPGARVLRLEQNYRSTQNILDVASALVAHNLQRKGKTLVAVKEKGARVRLHQAGDEYQEAAWVVGRIQELFGRGRQAVLFRMNAQSRVFEEALLRNRIGYIVVGGVGFYQRKEVRDVLAYLRLLRNPADAIALRRVINVPARGIGERTVEELGRVAAERRITLFEALRAVEDEALLPARATQPLRRFRETIEMLRHDVDGLSVKDTIERVLAASGYAQALAQEDSQDSQSRLENLAELLSAAADHDTRSENPSVTAFLDEVSLLSDQDEVKDEAPVVLLTLHAVKGLEYDNVFLVGMEEGLAPHARSLAREDGIEEERRLIYVGMTRARERLFLSFAQTRQVFGQRRPSDPSRFLTELPRAALEVSGEEPRPAARPSSAWGRRPSAARPAPGWTSSLPAPEPAPDFRGVSGPDPRSLKPGAKVRHPLFGVGTVVRNEGAGDDLKVTVSFLGIGAKKLVAKYAGLELL
ncbi:MAG TPA: 3'-5' exonuclease, partial [Vicinamibacteria bacterium]|nr:3'-5' exonuclease [Vicinamibacteria bacterium]